MLPLPNPVLNGVTVTHEELAAFHQNMRTAVRAATEERCLQGARLLDPERGERYILKAHGRDSHGNLLGSVTIYMPWSGAPYVRRFRLVRSSRTSTSTRRLG